MVAKRVSFPQMEGRRGGETVRRQRRRGILVDSGSVMFEHFKAVTAIIRTRSGVKNV